MTNIFIQAGEGNLPFVQANLPALGMNHADPNGYTCMHAASSYTCIAVLEWLVKNGADVNVKDEDGDTPLHHAETQEAAAWLVANGADHQVKNVEGMMPMQAKMEEQIAPTSVDYDSEDEEQSNATALLGYFMTLSYDEAIKKGGEETKKIFIG